MSNCLMTNPRSDPQEKSRDPAQTSATNAINNDWSVLLRSSPETHSN